MVRFSNNYSDTFWLFVCLLVCWWVFVLFVCYCVCWCGGVFVCVFVCLCVLMLVGMFIWSIPAKSVQTRFLRVENKLASTVFSFRQWIAHILVLHDLTFHHLFSKIKAGRMIVWCDHNTHVLPTNTTTMFS